MNRWSVEFRQGRGGTDARGKGQKEVHACHNLEMDAQGYADDRAQVDEERQMGNDWLGQKRRIKKDS